MAWLGVAAVMAFALIVLRRSATEDQDWRCPDEVES